LTEAVSDALRQSGIDVTKPAPDTFFHPSEIDEALRFNGTIDPATPEGFDRSVNNALEIVDNLGIMYDQHLLAGRTADAARIRPVLEVLEGYMRELAASTARERGIAPPAIGKVDLAAYGSAESLQQALVAYANWFSADAGMGRGGIIDLPQRPVP
jgi:hypothetical protein